MPVDEERQERAQREQNELLPARRASLRERGRSLANTARGAGVRHGQVKESLHVRPRTRSSRAAVYHAPGWLGDALAACRRLCWKSCANAGMARPAALPANEDCTDPNKRLKNRPDSDPRWSGQARQRRKNGARHSGCRRTGRNARLPARAVRLAVLLSGRRRVVLRPRRTGDGSHGAGDRSSREGMRGLGRDAHFREARAGRVSQQCGRARHARRDARSVS